LTLLASACNKGAEEELTRRLAEINSKVVECKNQNAELEGEVNKLKRDLAKALADPSSIVLKDPEIIELVAELRGNEPGDVTVGKGDLDPATASKIVMQGARALQQCYERALKKNPDLQYRAGVQVLLGLTVQATGLVKAVDVSPSIDGELTECIQTAARRWKFPTFKGESVTIEQKIMLTPKT
jgi:hypothetical protein